jgi:hypothetical protein
MRAIVTTSVKRWIRWMLFACLLAGDLADGLTRPALAQQGSEEGVVNREYPLKALFLYNFGSYVEWPADTFANSDSPFVIGVLGSAPLEATLRDIASQKTIAGRKIRVEKYPTVESIRPCQILFITRNVSPQEQQMAVRRLEHQHVLIVGESAGFATQGGSVNFFVESNKVRFEINPDAARQHQLKINSKLLTLAKIVQ